MPTWFGPWELMFLLLFVGLPAACVVWAFRTLSRRKCPRCGYGVKRGDLTCDRCGFDFRTVGSDAPLPGA